ncbi:MAG: MFS transporter [Actinomycetes bacterium]
MLTRLRENYSGMPKEVYVLTAVAFCVAIGFGMFAPVITVFAKQFDVSDFAASIIISIFAAARLVCTAPSTWMVTRFGEPIVLASGLLIVAISSVLIGFAHSYNDFLIYRASGGLGSAMFTVSALALLLRVTPATMRGRASGLYQGGFVVGGIAGPAVGAVFAFSLRLPFFVNAAMLVIASIFTFVMLLHPRYSVDASSSQPDSAANQEAASRGWSGLRKALQLPVYRLILWANFVQGFVLFGLRNALVPLYAKDQFGSTVYSNYSFAVGAIFSATLLVAAGRQTDLRGRKPVTVLGFALNAAGALVMVFSPNPAMFLVSAMLYGVGGALTGASIPAMLGDVTRGARSGVLVASYQAIVDVGFITGPILAGFVLEQTHSFNAAFGVGAALTCVALIWALTIPESKPSNEASRTPGDADSTSESPARALPSVMIDNELK